MNAFALQPSPRYAAYSGGPARPVFLGEADMKFILGVFVGAALMLGSAYLHDIGIVRAGPPQPFVNWEIVFGMLGR
jgi:hypothetical protein